jgi:large subunit ribosomal protein L19
MDLLRYFEKQQVKTLDRPRLQAGDIVRIETKIEEADKSRLQTFEGTVLSVRGSGPSITFTVRRETGNFGVERIFPLYSPLITNIEITKRQKVRRAKLNYLRQAGRRRFKEDVRAMQRHTKDENEKIRLAEDALKREENKKAEEEKAQQKEAKKAESEVKQEKEVTESTEKPEVSEGTEDK